MKRFLFALACSLTQGASANKLEHPFFQKEYKGNHTAGEIEIVSEPHKIKEIQSVQAQRLQKKGLSLKDADDAARTGIIAEDTYWLWVRDAVLFPSGAGGTYNRLLWKSSLQGAPGVAVLPILPNGKIVLNLNFRHATRSWELEVPRGMREAGENQEQCAKRELQEETGFSVSKLQFLGELAPDTGVLNSVVPVYAGWVEKVGEASPEISEAILETRSFSLEELKQGLRQGYLSLGPQGKAYVRDSFLTYALFQLANQNEGTL